MLNNLLAENEPPDLIDCIDLEKISSLEEDTSKPNMLRKRSTKYPSTQTNPSVALFLKQVTAKIEKIQGTQPPNPNLTPQQLQVLQNLMNREYLTIKPSDKGGNIVIFKTNKYERMCLDILTKIGTR